MRALVICQEDPEDILGGMGRHVCELYRELSLKGVEIDLLTQGTGEGSVDFMGFTKHLDDKHICFKPRKPDFACRLMVDLQMAKTLTRLIAERGKDYWDVIHQHEWTSVQIARMARRALDLPLVGTMHLCLSHLAMLEDPTTNPGSWGQSDQYMMQQEGNLICDPDELILCSDSYVKMARQHFLTERPINRIYNGVNINEWNPEAGDGARARDRHALDHVVGHAVQPQRPVALFCGRIAEMKGIVYLLDALEVDLGWQVLLAGEVNANDETAREEWHITKYIRDIERAHPERLRWVGFQRGQALRDLYAAADCVVMPSTHEPFGIVALEAMAMGAPLIATEVDGLGEIVCDGDKEFAMIIPPRSSKSIAQALGVLRDPLIRAELRDLGLRRVRDFSWEKAAESTLAVYRQAMSYGGLRAQEENRC